jgi:hypothetical protein
MLGTKYKLYIATHSLSTVFTQYYISKNNEVFAGQIFMGGGI